MQRSVQNFLRMVAISLPKARFGRDHEHREEPRSSLNSDTLQRLLYLQIIFPLTERRLAARRSGSLEASWTRIQIADFRIIRIPEFHSFVSWGWRLTRIDISGAQKYHHSQGRRIYFDRAEPDMSALPSDMRAARLSSIERRRKISLVVAPSETAAAGGTAGGFKRGYMS